MKKNIEARIENLFSEVECLLKGLDSLNYKLKKLEKEIFPENVSDDSHKNKGTCISEYLDNSVDCESLPKPWVVAMKELLDDESDLPDCYEEDGWLLSPPYYCNDTGKWLHQIPPTDCLPNEVNCYITVVKNKLKTIRLISNLILNNDEKSEHGSNLLLASKMIKNSNHNAAVFLGKMNKSKAHRLAYDFLESASIVFRHPNKSNY